MKYLHSVAIIGLIGSLLLIYGFFALLNYIFEYATILSGFGLTYQIISSDLLTFFILNAILQLIFGIIALISSIFVIKEKKIGVYILFCIGIITSIFMFIVIYPRQEYMLSPDITLIIGPIRLLSNHTIDITPFIILIAGLLPFILKSDEWVIINKDKKIS
ncbi:MAG: hypothetical protein ACFE94_07100 [Candidatus Hodarchaeota archaeon]